MRMTKLRHFAGAGALALGFTSFGIIAPSIPANAANGGCPSIAHRVHTADTSPYHGWSCWIDNGDKIRVCDDDPNDGVHVHADLWFDAGGFWYKFIGEDDGDDAGCDDQGGGNLQGYNRLRLRVCAQREDQTNFSCNEVIWFENE